MKNKSSKSSNRINPNIFPVQVAGTPRSCECGVNVRRGIMWEFQATLYCSRRCASEAENRANSAISEDADVA